MSPTRIVMVIDNVNMGKGHDGLTAIAKQFKLDPTKLKPGELLMFINRAKDKLKVYGPGHVIGYLRMPGKRKLTMEAIQYLPQAFNPDGSIDYDKALKQAVIKMLEKQKAVIGPLRAYRAGKAAGVTAST